MSTSPVKKALSIPKEASGITRSTLILTALFSLLAGEERTLLRHLSGRAENVAEHSEMLALVAPAIAEAYYPELDANLVCRFAAIHDTVEAYVGDISTHYLNEQALQEKAQLETNAIKNFKEDFADLPHFVHLIEQYHAQELPEARFVRLLDKWTPILLHYTDHGATLRSYTTAKDLLDEYKPRAERLKKQFPEFRELVAVREELNQLAAKYLF